MNRKSKTKRDIKDKSKIQVVGPIENALEMRIVQSLWCGLRWANEAHFRNYNSSVKAPEYKTECEDIW